MQPELTLLQFVALSLPAVAILLQAVTQYHDDLDSYVNKTWTEIRLIQYSFYTLVFAGLVFSAPLFLNSDSPYVQGGILIAGTALFMLIPATWFGLRRGRYGPSDYDSPEQEMISKLRTGIPIIVVLGIFPALFFFSSETTNFINSIFGENITSLVLGTNLMALGASIFVLLTRVVKSFVEYRQRERGVQIWKRNAITHADNLSQNLTTGDRNLQSPNQLREFRSQLKSAKEDWSQLKDSAPESMDEEVRKKVDTIYSSLTFMIDLINEGIEAYETESTYQTDLENMKSLLLDLKEKKDRIDEEIDQIEQSQTELAEQLNEFNKNIAEAEERVTQVEGMIDEAKTTRENVTEELENRRKSLIEEIETLRQNLSG